MPRDYGVLVARAVDLNWDDGTDSPHFHIHVVDDAGTNYRIQVNATSQQSPSGLLYLVHDQFEHPILGLLPQSGWTALPGRPGGPGLDFIRGNLFDRSQMRLLPCDISGTDNDVAGLLALHANRALYDPDARLYVFGERWGPEPGRPDRIFGFRDGAGVHDIHMNQGNIGAFASDDGVWQDGGLLLHLPRRAQWVAIFLAFGSQSWHSDDTTGLSIDAPIGRRGAINEPPPVRIIGALVNPTGPSPRAERVTLLNASADAVDLSGWSLSDSRKRTTPVIPSGRPGQLPAGETLAVELTDTLLLSSRGGTITLLDGQALKIDGVSITPSQASRAGWTVVF